MYPYKFLWISLGLWVFVEWNRPFLAPPYLNLDKPTRLFLYYHLYIFFRTMRKSPFISLYFEIRLTTVLTLWVRYATVATGRLNIRDLLGLWVFVKWKPSFPSLSTFESEKLARLSFHKLFIRFSWNHKKAPPLIYSLRDLANDGFISGIDRWLLSQAVSSFRIYWVFWVFAKWNCPF